MFLAVKKSKKMLQFVVQSCSIKNCAKKSCLIIDDETYRAAYFRSLQYQYYSAINRKKLNSKYKCIGIHKFAKKFLVWQAICECGERNSCFVTTGTINTEIYIKESLKKRLLPFFRISYG